MNLDPSTVLERREDCRGSVLRAALRSSAAATNFSIDA
jgi:hypothetical protein